MQQSGLICSETDIPSVKEFLEKQRINLATTGHSQNNCLDSLLELKSTPKVQSLTIGVSPMESPYSLLSLTGALYVFLIIIFFIISLKQVSFVTHHFPCPE